MKVDGEKRKVESTATQFVSAMLSTFHFPLSSPLLLAVSGGRDSVCMAHLMHAAGYSFAIAHCNFHLRPGDCDRDQDFVHQLATQLQAEFYTTDFDTLGYARAQGMSVEEAARELRYHWFSDLCSRHGFAAVATAHHRDDAVETFFLNLFRGTGIAGLHGIQPVVEVKSGPHSTFTVVRPLLNCSRADIDRYIAEHHLAYVEDSTNAQLDARRNRIRHRLMPLLRELYPSVDDTMQANIQRLSDVEQVYRTYVDQLRVRLVKPYVSRVPDLPMPIVSIALADLPSPRTTLLFELLRPYGFNGATVDDILQPLKPSGRLFYSQTHVAELHRGLLLVAPKVEPAPGRHPAPGDRIRLKTGSRLLSDYLKDQGISRIERRHVQLTADVTASSRSARSEGPFWYTNIV